MTETLKQQLDRLSEAATKPAWPYPDICTSQEEHYFHSELADLFRSGELSVTADTRREALEEAAKKAVDWVNGDFGMAEEEAAEIGISGFIRALIEKETFDD